MDQSCKLELFISYSHEDEDFIKNFRKHLCTLKDNGLIKDWYDRKILPGKEFQDEINKNLENADIICLCISANFLSSDSCKKEIIKSLELRNYKNVSVNPIILSPCTWSDNKSISKLLVMPTDGKPVSAFTDHNDAWVNVYNGLKRVIEVEIKIRQINIKKEFETFLKDTEMLSASHSQKERVFLDDIFVYPELLAYDYVNHKQKTINSRGMLSNILQYKNIVIAGENQSGKTTLCKKIFKELRGNNFFPVYVSSVKGAYAGKIENIISNSFKTQYEGIGTDEIEKGRLIPILDDFYFTKNKEKHINDLILLDYRCCVVVVDDIFNLNIKNEELIKSFHYFKILELKSSLRNELIKKWELLTDKENINAANSDYKEIDKMAESVELTMLSGVMPFYPFYILSTIMTYETFNKPLGEEITSQGFCYQAFIYFYLGKTGVKNDDVGIYINFLTELAFYLFKEKKCELSTADFDIFIDIYKLKYNLPIKKEIFLNNLALIILTDSFNNYSFHFKYLYYFFVAKYLAENIGDDDTDKIIKNIIKNLQVDENAYISIFMAHHSKNVFILNEIEGNIAILFNKYKPVGLTIDDIRFFDEEANNIAKAILPSNSNPEKERSEILRARDEIEQRDKPQNIEEEYDPLESDLRRSIKTAEVIGCIMKNRAGSLEKTKLEKIFKDAMNVHLRILSYFFEIIKSKENQLYIVGMISNEIEKINDKKGENMSREKRDAIAKAIFWNLNFFTVYGVIYKIIHSLGSDKLTQIINKVCDEIDTPASFLVKHGILMWYDKNMQVNNIMARIKKNDFSGIAKKVVEFLIVNHCALHKVTFRDKQRIQSQFREISTEQLSKGSTVDKK